MSEGRLVVCATPIGNLGDVTLRVLEELRSVDVIEAEDTRVTRKLLSRYAITTPLEPYHAKNIERRTPELVERVLTGQSIALVSDAGTPGVSDPGAHLVDACIAAGAIVEVLPGASAILTALVASGLPTHAFYFGGFLSRKAGDRMRALERLASLDATLVFYESPRRTAATLASLAEVLPGRTAVMARELTKMHEEVVRGDVEQLAQEIAGRELKGEVVLLIGPPPRGREAEALASDPVALRAQVEALVARGTTRKDAVRAVSERTGVARNDVYDAAIAAPGKTDTGS
jgi:16S rRNA (cytidine1402-2'-O)-methyltransferase